MYVMHTLSEDSRRHRTGPFSFSCRLGSTEDSGMICCWCMRPTRLSLGCVGGCWPLASSIVHARCRPPSRTLISLSTCGYFFLFCSIRPLACRARTDPCTGWWARKGSLNRCGTCSFTSSSSPCCEFFSMYSISTGLSGGCHRRDGWALPFFLPPLVEEWA